jgi:hypothetical protein
MEISDLIKSLGIITYVLVILTFLAGLLRAKLRLKLKHHKALAWAAVTSASLHALLVLVFY